MNFTQDEINIFLKVFKNIKLCDSKIEINEFICVEKKKINLRSLSSFVPVMGYSVELYLPSGIMNQIYECANLIDAIKIMKNKQNELEIDSMIAEN